MFVYTLIGESKLETMQKCARNNHVVSNVSAPATWWRSVSYCQVNILYVSGHSDIGRQGPREACTLYVSL
jgi:hypothetical protein